MNALFAAPAPQSASTSAERAQAVESADLAEALRTRAESGTESPAAPQSEAEAQPAPAAEPPAAAQPAPPPADESFDQPQSAAHAAGTLRERLRGAWGWAWLVWALGAGLLLLRRIGGYGLCLRRLRRDLAPAEDPALLALYRACCAQLGIRRAPPLCYSGAVSSPMLTGVLRPRVILPRGEAAAQGMRCVLLHELTHYRRRDIPYKWLAQLALCVHWFNPVVRLAVREIGRACELACDEAVIRTMNTEEKYGYGDTLIATVRRGAPGRGSAGSLALSEDARLLKERLGSILNYRKLPRYTRVLSFALSVLLLAGALFAGVYAAGSAAEQAARTAAKGKSSSITGSASPAASHTTGNSHQSWGERTNFQRVVLADTGAAKELLITVESAGIRLLPAEDGKVSYEYREDLNDVVCKLEGERLIISLDGNKGAGVRNNGREDTTLELYLPAAQWREMTVRTESGAVSLPAQADTLSLEASNSAVSVSVPADYAGAMSLKFENSAAAVILDDDFKSVAVTVQGDGSAVSMPTGFPNFYLTRDYSHTVGTGDATIDVELSGCAFSMAYQNVLDNPGNYADSILSGIAEGVSENAGDWSDAMKDAWKNSGGKETVINSLEGALDASNFAELWDEAWSEAWSEIDWSEIWREAWDEAMDEVSNAVSAPGAFTRSR